MLTGFSSQDNWRWPRPTWIFATRTGACACMFPSINCEFIDFESLNDKDFSSGLFEILSFSNCFKYTYYRAIFPIQLRLDAFCLFAKQNLACSRLSDPCTPQFPSVLFSSSRFLNSSRPDYLGAWNRLNKTELITSLGFDWFDWVRNRTHRKVPVRLCSITEPIEQQSDRLGSIDFWFGFIQLTTPGAEPSECNDPSDESSTQKGEAVVHGYQFQGDLWPGPYASAPPPQKSRRSVSVLTTTKSPFKVWCLMTS